MNDPIYHDATGRPYTVRDGVSMWLDQSVAMQPELEYAGFGRRAGARAIDTVIVYAVSFALGIVLVISTDLIYAVTGLDLYPAGSETMTLPSFVLSALAVMAFYSIAEVLHGSTPGKLMLGMIVRSETGGACGIGQSLKRGVAFYVDSLVFGLPALNSMRSTPRNQRIGDKWGKTVVVMSTSLDPSDRPSTGRFVGATALALAVYAVIVLMSLWA